MFLTPTEAISRIEADRALVNRRFEQLRSVAQDLIELGIPEEEFLKQKPLQHRKETKKTVRYELTSETTGGKWVEECANYVKMLKSFRNGKRKPSEETVNSITAELIIDFCFTSSMTPSETLGVIDEDKADTNKKLDELKHVCVVLKKYGVTDSDYRRAFAQYTLYSDRIKNMVDFTFCKELTEALDLAHYVEESGFRPYRSWWDRLFRNEQMDSTLKATLNRMLELYVRITNSW